MLTRDELARRRQLTATAEPLEMILSEGVISGADRMRAGYDAHLTAAVLSAIDWPDRRAGIFVLSPAELEHLGDLSPEEGALLRPTINTKDVLPYAALVSDTAGHMIYLPAPDTVRDGAETDDGEFPQAPRLLSYLRQFKPLLSQKVESYGERRPWWSLHRPRPEIMLKQSDDGRWADYALTTRWGGGEKLIVGMAPNHAVPLSGLHALLPPPGVSAGYVVGLLNSTVVQEMAEALPPGEIRQSDLHGLGLPLIDEAQDEIAATALELANLVSIFLEDQGDQWPLLETEMRSDIALGSLPFELWLPSVGPATSWGRLRDLAWIDAIESSGTLSSKIESVDLTRDLFGPAIVAGGGRTGRLEIRIEEDNDELLEALEAYLNGLKTRGAALRDVPDAPAPVSSEKLIDLRLSSRTKLEEFGGEYQRLRASIDSVVDQLM